MYIFPFKFRTASWTEDHDKIMNVRTEVFIKEQNVPPDIEQDSDDPGCIHFLCETLDGKPVATARLASDGKIGRMAVLKDWRSRKVGTELMKFVLNHAMKEGHCSFYLHAQTHVINFYAKFGFKEEGDIFYEANIPHKKMVLTF